ncbi:hypothetical protein Tco_0652067 [Tanacetum coccineum]|uniref:Uncharacterized protein n=1 Tax=Tanacetum coccineum TaxID=301880 RepID=A0ABQ4WWJ3_9ASTR
MAALVSCPKHNMVACLEKTERNAQFHEIVDFLTRSSIYYSLTVSPTVSTSLIEQFWNTATSKIVNDVNGIDCLTNQEIYENLQLMGSKSTSWDQFPTNIASALICLATDRKFNFSKMIFEGMIRNLDAKKQFLMYPRFVQVFLNNQLSNLPAPLDNLPIPVLTKKVFTNMAKQGLHVLGHVTTLFPNMLAQAVVDEGEGSEQPTEPQPTPSPTQPSTGDQPPMTESSYRPDTTQDPRVNLEGTGGSQGDHVQIPHDSPLLGGHTSDRAEGGLNLDELLILCTNLSNRVLALETSKDAQAAEILKLKTRIKKLEKKCKPNISHHRAWLRSVSRLSRTKKLGKKESVSKQGRKNAKPGPTLDAFDDLDADLAHGMDYMETEEAGSGEKRVSTVSTARPDIDTARPEVHTANAPVSTAGVTISTADPEVSVVEPRTPPTTTSIFDDEDITMAQTLIKMKEEKAKEKGVAFKDVEDSSRPIRSITTLKPLPSIDPKDKGKGVLEEPEPAKKMTRKVELERQGEEQASMDYITNLYDEVQARIDADHELAVILTHEEQDKSKEDERLIQKINKKAAGVDVEEVLKEPNSTKVKVKLEEVKQGTKKTPGKTVKMKARKKARKQTHADTDNEHDSKEDERKIESMNKEDAGESNEKVSDVSKKRKGVPDEEGIINFEVLEKLFPIINWESKFYHYDKHGAGIYYRIFRSDGSSRWIKTFSEMVTRFDRLDLVELYNLVMQRFETITPEGVDLVLWGDLWTMFDANAEEELWQNQERWNLKSWNFYKNCGVHTLTLEDAKSASDSAYDLLRFIQKQIDEAGSHDGGEKDL